MISTFLLIPGCFKKRFFNLSNLPNPNGIYSVGTIEFDWLNKGYKNLFNDKIDDKRRMMVQFWYPGIFDEAREPSLYSNNPKVIEALSKEYKISPVLLKNSLEIKTNSFYDLDPLPNEKNYPLIIFSHGKGGYKGQNTVQCEELASHGYIVASIDHSYDALITVFSDGSIAPYVSDNPKKVGGEIESDRITNNKLMSRVSDVRYLLDKIWNDNNYHPIFSLIDTSNVGMFGHSFGVATTVLSAQTDTRIKVIAGLDGWFEPISEEKLDKGIEVPFLHLGRKKWHFNPTNYENMERLSINSSELINHFPIKRLQHFDFMDGSQLASLSIKLSLSYLSSYDKHKIRELLNSMLLTYFNFKLKRESSATLESVSKHFKIITN